MQNAKESVGSATKVRGAKPPKFPRPANKIAKTTKTSKLTKIEQLEQALARKNRATIAVLERKLGWQKHTVRAAISRLRKAGAAIVTGKNAKTGETVYRLEKASRADPTSSDERSKAFSTGTATAAGIGTTAEAA